MTLTLGTYLLVCPLIFLGGFIDSIAGGGGLITLPAYYLAGLPPSLAGGTNKLSAFSGTAISTARFAAGGLIHWKQGAASLLGAFPGAAFGAFLLTRVPAAYAKLGILLALPLVAVVVLRNRSLEPRPALVPPRLTLPACFAIGLVIGVYDGLVGPGTGTFLLLAYLTLMGDSALTANGTAKLVNLGTNLGSLISLILTGNVLFALALPAAAFGIAGNYLGASLAIQKGAPFIRVLLLVVLGLLMVKLLADAVPALMK